MEQLAVLDTTSPPVVLRRAVADDLPAMVALLAVYPLGASREADPSDPGALDVIQDDQAHLLVVAVATGRLVGTLQLSFIPGLARRGALRAQIEAVRVDETFHRFYQRLGFVA